MGKSFNKKMTEKLDKQKGITLIALIITIIILIILATITINNVMNSDLFGLAKGAAENYIKVGEEEGKAIDKLVGVLSNSGVGKESKVKAEEIVTTIEKDNYTDVDGRKATVPAGFKVSTKSSEQYIEDGLVIQDKDGNEFVWVPCYVDSKPKGTADDVQKYEKHIYVGTTTKTDDTYDTTQDEGYDNWKTFFYTKFGNNWQDTEATEYGNTSVSKYGGFYIARYEAGWAETVTSNLSASTNYIENYETEKNKKNITTKKPVSKANVFSWNFISQKNAKEVSEKMYESVTYNDSSKYNDSVDSKLIDGTAWDTVTNWIATDNVDVTTSLSYGNYWDNNSTYTGWYAEHVWGGQRQSQEGGVPGWLYAKHFTNGTVQLNMVRLTNDLTQQFTELWKTKKNNYTDSDNADATKNYLDTRIEIPTGSYGDFKLKNIYDLAGNMSEWTTEIGYQVENGDKFAVLRGGGLANTGEHDPLCCRNGAFVCDSTNVDFGFRVVLYIK